MACLESIKRYNFECRSAMYYYEMGECILNREWHGTSHPALFTDDTRFQLVDYFENNCYDGYKFFIPIYKLLFF